MSPAPFHRLTRAALDVPQGNTPIRAARALVSGIDSAVVPLATARGTLAARTSDLRLAVHLGRDGDLADLAVDGLVHQDEASAATWLAADPSRSGAVVNAADPIILERRPDRIRHAIVMAGGRGERLRPLTDDTPKPLLEVGGRKLLHRILDHLQAHGVDRLFVSVRYLSEKVRDAIGDGSEWNMTATYLEEDEPLDTGAGLALLDGVDEPFFVINGDILSTINLTALGRWHSLNDNLATIATHRYAAPLPYGVVHGDGTRVVDIEEKPVYRYDINAGIYAFSPEVLGMVEKGRPLAMVDFLNAQARATERVRSFPVIEYWNDVGTRADFDRAQTEVFEL